MDWGENDSRPSSRSGSRRYSHSNARSGARATPRPTPRKGRWSQIEIAKLKDLYGLRDEKSIARELQRSAASVRRMADSLFRSAHKTGPWSAQETKQLKRYLGASAAETIARILGRERGEVESKILELGRIRQPNARWTRDETLRFKRIYGTRSDEDLSAIFGRPTEDIARQANKLCLAKDKAFLRKLNGNGATRMPRWAEDELDYLRMSYAVTSNIEIAKRLRRSIKSVISKAHHIGLKKAAERLREMGRENVSLRYNGVE